MQYTPNCNARVSVGYSLWTGDHTGTPRAIIQYMEHVFRMTACNALNLSFRLQSVSIALNNSL